MSFSEIFKNHRKSLGLTQEDIAGMLSVTPQAVSKWETGMATPDISLLVPISRIFMITTDELLNNEAVDDLKIAEELDDARDSDADILEKYERYVETLKKYPNSSDALARSIGMIATVLANKCREFGKDQVDAFVSEAECFSRRLRENSKSKNDFVYSHALLADVYMNAGRFSDAEEEIEYLPYCRYGKARMMGNLRIKEKRYEEALEFYRESISDAIVWLIWDIERSAQCIWKTTGDNSYPMKIFRLEHDLISLLYNGSSYPIPLSSNLMYVNMQLAANAARKGKSDECFSYLEELLLLAEEYERRYGRCFETGCLLFPEAKQPYDKARKKARSFKSWILRSLEWNSFESIKEDPRYCLILARVNALK